MRFIDLFSGLGGFHLGLSRLGHECVFACEIDEHLRGIYKKNFGITPRADIREVKLNSIPEHDILCAAVPVSRSPRQANSRGWNARNGAICFITSYAL